MFKHLDDGEWNEYLEKGFSIDLNEAIDEQLERSDGNVLYDEIAEKLVGLLSQEDLSLLAFEGLRNRVGAYIRSLRRPAPRTSNGSARWDNVAENRNKLEEHYVRTGRGRGVKPLLECTAFDLEGAVAYYTEQGNSFHAKAKAYDEVKGLLVREGADTVADVDQALVERRLRV